MVLIIITGLLSFFGLGLRVPNSYYCCQHDDSYHYYWFTITGVFPFLITVSINTGSTITAMILSIIFLLWFFLLVLLSFLLCLRPYYDFDLYFW